MRHKNLSKTYFCIITYSTFVASMPFRNEIFLTRTACTGASTTPVKREPDLFAGNKTAIEWR